jgi:hypothetical protein
MRQQRSIILYLFVSVLIVIGVLLFIFKDALVSRFLNYSIEGEVVTVKKETNIIKLDVLNDSRIKALKNYTSTFNYSSLEETQKALMTEFNNRNNVIITNPDDADNPVINTETFNQVRVGNSNPFIVNKVKK